VSSARLLCVAAVAVLGVSAVGLVAAGRGDSYALFHAGIPSTAAALPPSVSASSAAPSPSAPAGKEPPPRGAASPAAAPAAAPSVVPSVESGQVTTFEIDGTGKADVTYVDPDLQVRQVSGAALPWRKKFPRTGPAMNVTANRTAGDHATITCRILRGGTVVATNTATGPFAVVSCVER